MKPTAHGTSAVAADPGTYTPQPNLVGEITAALVASKIDRLTPHTSQQKGRNFSYNLQSVTCLGSIEHGSESFLLATALFTRSSAENSESPPARGHGFLLCFSRRFELVSWCPLDFPQVLLDGTQLLRGQEIIADFSTGSRTHGFLVDGSNFLPYPFADRLPPPSPPETP